MIFIKNLNKITDSKYDIGYKHYMPFDSTNGLNKTKEQLEQEGILIEGISEPQQIEGKQSIMYYNPVENIIFYEYEDILKPKENIEKETFTKTLAELTVENKKKDAMISQLAQQVSNLNIKINQLGGK
ncbi:hypothetical protein BD780_000227 [Clostridium tetanomorphum]|uniref:hypothetical protein n=1 Tax=Clostridium tetanomorphum TaxID=1553 RepID=UPI000448A3C7|nr:hypothetical protein [Clostridium tetanomorphum]KAJ51105.1 hypothetical protein CTM_14503 [Clostridium tetanomorphum DSM 665]MBP1864467.1 hypothetical protein [Clostridium tetanomorphum]NRS83002.1 hypothetical protein [Clostridium tetanomorphum]NRZ98902.1 hypothetical protein [Clostridium tetanomorphum]SQC01040.1 phage protein [Clostridium tetanomorphum]